MADAYACVTGTPGVCIRSERPRRHQHGHQHGRCLPRPLPGHPPPRRRAGRRDLDGFQEIDQLKIFDAAGADPGAAAPTAWPSRSAPPSASPWPSAGPCRSTSPATSLRRGRLRDPRPSASRAPRGGGDERSWTGPPSCWPARRGQPSSRAWALSRPTASRPCALAERLDCPVICSYLHNDAFPWDHELAVGPIGYMGSKAAMNLLSEADVVLALGTRLSVRHPAPVRLRLLPARGQDRPGGHQPAPAGASGRSRWGSSADERPRRDLAPARGLATAAHRRGPAGACGRRRRRLRELADSRPSTPRPSARGGRSRSWRRAHRGRDGHHGHRQHLLGGQLVPASPSRASTWPRAHLRQLRLRLIMGAKLARLGPRAG